MHLALNVRPSAFYNTSSPRLRRAGGALILTTALLSIPSLSSATGSSCTFKAKGLSLDFGFLDPSSGATVTARSTAATRGADEVGACTSPVMLIVADQGLNPGGGSPRMTNGVDFIPYSLALPILVFGPGDNSTSVNYSIVGTVLGPSYQNASAGVYGDSVTITVFP